MLAASMVMAVLLQNVQAAVPSPQTLDPDRFSVGASFGPVLIMPSVLPAVRIGLQLTGTLAVDFDIGSSLSWGRRDVGQVADGLSLGGQLRWARNGRRPDGTSRYWLVGPHFANGRDFSPDARREYAMRSVQVGYGVDSTRGRWRVGGELSVSIVGDGEALVRVVVARGVR